MNWMLPLETLPGWPEAPEVSDASLLMLMVIGPLALGAVVAILTFTPRLSRRFRGEDHATSNEVARREQHSAPEQRV